MILKIDVQGAQVVKEKVADALLIFVVPPSLEALFQRLRARATESADQLELRQRNAAIELARQGDYDYVVVNETGAVERHGRDHRPHRPCRAAQAPDTPGARLGRARGRDAAHVRRGRRPGQPRLALDDPHGPSDGAAGSIADDGIGAGGLRGGGGRRAGWAGARTYTYDVPERLADVEPGEAVLVEYGRRRALGVVLGDATRPPDREAKPIADRIRADGPLLPELTLRLARWIAEHVPRPARDDDPGVPAAGHARTRRARGRAPPEAPGAGARAGSPEPALDATDRALLEQIHAGPRRDP